MSPAAAPWLWAYYAELVRLLATPLVIAVIAAVSGNVSAVLVAVLLSRRLERNSKVLDTIHAHLVNGGPKSGNGG